MRLRGSARTVLAGLGFAAGVAALLLLPVGDLTAGRVPDPSPSPEVTRTAIVVRVQPPRSPDAVRVLLRQRAGDVAPAPPEVGPDRR